MKKIIFIVSLISNIASAALVENVKVLSVDTRQNSIELKLQSKDSPKNSHFFVEIPKDDSDSFDKMAHVIKKLQEQDKYKLDLNIPSFSASPSGSFYRSGDITFYGTLIKAAR